MYGVLLCILLYVAQTIGIGEVIWAVNCGGDSHTDIHGIRYQKDVLSTGIPSDFGKSLMIQRVIPQDQVLYQTERYDTSSFGYSVPIKTDGDYVLVLKFSEVWFTAPNQKVSRVITIKIKSDSFKFQSSWTNATPIIILLDTTIIVTNYYY